MWCKTQAVVALSSAEAKLYGLVRASAETLGLISMYKDLSTHTHEWIGTGRCERNSPIVAQKGLGKLRHLDTNYWWIQENAAMGDLNFKKVAGVDNGADLFTKTCRGTRYEPHPQIELTVYQNEFSVNYVGARPHGVDLR